MRGKRNEPTVEPDILDYCYAAGFVDGEGTITVRESQVTKGHPTWNPSWFASVTVAQVDPRPLQWMQERWGGGIYAVKPRKENHRFAWQWSIVNQQAYVFLEGVVPMLKVKKASAMNALRLKPMRDGRGYALGGGNRNHLSPDEINERQSIRTEALRLNSRSNVWLELP